MLWTGSHWWNRSVNSIGSCWAIVVLSSLILYRLLPHPPAAAANTTTDSTSLSVTLLALELTSTQQSLLCSYQQQTSVSAIAVGKARARDRSLFWIIRAFLFTYHSFQHHHVSKPCILLFVVDARKIAETTPSCRSQTSQRRRQHALQGAQSIVGQGPQRPRRRNSWRPISSPRRNPRTDCHPPNAISTLTVKYALAQTGLQHGLSPPSAELYFH